MQHHNDSGIKIIQKDFKAAVIKMFLWTIMRCWKQMKKYECPKETINPKNKMEILELKI